MNNLFLKTFGLFKVPLIFFVSPKIIKLDDHITEIKIPLSWKTKNHLKSMYFGALCVGADLAAGIVAMKYIKQSKKNVHLSFKELNVEFLKRAMGATHFYCDQNEEIQSFVNEVINNPGIRKNKIVKIVAKCPEISEEEVAVFKLSLSLKYKLI